MKRLHRLLPALLPAAGLALGCEPPDDVSSHVARGPAPEFFLGGIGVNEPDLRRWATSLQAEGMNTVSVTDYARHGDWDSDRLEWDETNAKVLAEIRAVKDQGLAVVLILRVDLDQQSARNRFLWHGMILPRTEALIGSWFDSYTRFALHWAEIAEREGVDVLMIGSELNALASTLPLAEVPALEEYFLNDDKQAARREELLRHQDAVEDLEATVDARIANERAWAEVAGSAGASGRVDLEGINRRRQRLNSHWAELVTQVREVFSGAVGYAANFDQYQTVGFWQHLDAMGINAYFQLRQRPLAEPSLLEAPEVAGRLEQSWREVLAEIDRFRHSQGVGEMPVIFTEMGYTYRLNSTLEPWAHDGFSLIKFYEEGRAGEQMVVWRDQPVAPRERALAINALWRAHRELESPFLQGILYWKLSTVPSHVDVESFVLLIDQPEDDPALAELRRFVDG